MELSHITYQGPPLDDSEILGQLPDSLKSLLNSLNGFIQFGGGLHVRGACTAPVWHSLRRAWHGPTAVHELFSSVNQDWVPFAEDCVGDQFLLKNELVVRLSAETGEVEDLEMSLFDFLRSAESDPVEFLAMQPLLQFRNDHGDLPEGQLILAYPPFCTEEAAKGVSLRSTAAWELHQFHSKLAKALPTDGDRLRIEISD